ncbi:hypothetical protein ACP70R_011792 [Stipagrostis hirtigluma subsp. patula]
MPPPSLHPPHPHFHKLKRRHRPAAMARKGLAAILFKLRDVHRPPPPPSSPAPPSPSTPPAHHYGGLCYPPPPSAWPWPSACRHPRTSSFRGPKDDAVYSTVNTVYDATSEQFLRRSSMDEPSCIDRSPLALPAAEQGEEVEEGEEKEVQLRETAVVRGVRSERLFFEPAGAEFLPKQQAAPARVENEAAAVVSAKNDEPAATSPSGKSEAAAEAPAAAAVKGGAVVVTLDSKDPYRDFRASMAEMVAAHGLRDWEALEELLALYLKLNAKCVHTAIVGAFVDLLVSLQPQQASPPSLPSPSPSSSCITFEEYSSATFDEEEDKS